MNKAKLFEQFREIRNNPELIQEVGRQLADRKAADDLEWLEYLKRKHPSDAELSAELDRQVAENAERMKDKDVATQV